MLELILSSQSPRRKILLEEWGYKFRTLSIEVSEILDENLNPSQQICQVAETKVLAAKEHLKSLKTNNYLALSADTAVIFENKILGKPKEAQEAVETLRLLSGNVHHVITAISLFDSTSEVLVSDFERTEVHFKTLSANEIQNYVQTGSPMDKAGSYGIQDVGEQFVSQIVGSFENVVGLPMQKLEKVLKNNDWFTRIRKN